MKATKIAKIFTVDLTFMPNPSATSKTKLAVFKLF